MRALVLVLVALRCKALCFSVPTPMSSTGVTPNKKHKIRDSIITFPTIFQPTSLKTPAPANMPRTLQTASLKLLKPINTSPMLLKTLSLNTPEPNTNPFTSMQFSSLSQPEHVTGSPSPRKPSYLNAAGYITLQKTPHQTLLSKILESTTMSTTTLKQSSVSTSEPVNILSTPLHKLTTSDQITAKPMSFITSSFTQPEDTGIRLTSLQKEPHNRKQPIDVRTTSFQTSSISKFRAFTTTLISSKTSSLTKHSSITIPSTSSHTLPPTKFLSVNTVSTSIQPSMKSTLEEIDSTPVIPQTSSMTKPNSFTTQMAFLKTMSFTSEHIADTSKSSKTLLLTTVQRIHTALTPTRLRLPTKLQPVTITPISDPPSPKTFGYIQTTSMLHKTSSFIKPRPVTTQVKTVQTSSLTSHETSQTSTSQPEVCDNKCQIIKPYALQCLTWKLPCSMPENITHMRLKYPLILLRKRQNYWEEETVISDSRLENITTLSFIFSFDCHKKNAMNLNLHLFPALSAINFEGGLPYCVRISTTHPQIANIYVNTRMFHSFSVNNADVQKYLLAFPNLKKLHLYRYSFDEDLIRFFSVPYSEKIEIEIDVELLRLFEPKLEILEFMNLPTSTIKFFDDGGSSCKANSSLKSVYFNNLLLDNVHYFVKSKCGIYTIEFNLSLLTSYCHINYRFWPDFSLMNIIGPNPVIFHDVFQQSKYWKRAARFRAKFFFSYGSEIQVYSNKIEVFKFNNQLTQLISYLYIIINFRPFHLFFSSLKIEYLAFSLFPWDDSYLDDVETLVLGNNTLGVMATDYKEDFSRIFLAFPMMVNVDLSINGLSYLPIHIFSRNTKLVKIWLFSNKLTNIQSGVFDHLRSLQVLDLSDNHIKHIDTDVRHGLKTMASLNKEFKMNLSGNILECSCADLSTYDWIANSMKSGILEMNESSCLTEQHGLLRFDKLETHCTLKIIYVILKVFAGILVLKMILVIVICRIRKRQRKIAKYLNQLKHGRSTKKHMIFVSYSSPDGRIVHELILPQIQKYLTDRALDDREFICTGDTHFKPGFNIIQEAMRCIDLCSVVLFIISKTFLESPFCRMELKEALNQAKPIILIMKGHIKQSQMPKFIRNIFNTNVRFHFVQRDRGIFQVMPSWDTLVEAILELAANEERDIKAIELLRGGKKNEENPGVEMEMQNIARRHIN